MQNADCKVKMQSNNSKIHFYIENIEDFLINISKPNQAEEFVYEINTAILPQTSSYASKLASNQDLLGDEYSNFLLFCSNISKIKILSYGEKYIVIIERKFLKNNSLEKNYFYTTLKLNSNADHFFESPKINFCIVENSSKIYELPEKKDSYEKRKNLFIITKFNNAWAVICYHAPQKYT